MGRRPGLDLESGASSVHARRRPARGTQRIGSSRLQDAFLMPPVETIPIAAASPEISPFEAVVVAAGAGVRLGAGVPKAFRLLAGRPLVWHAVRTLQDAGAGRVVVVVAADQLTSTQQRFADLALEADLVSGGRERQHSVLAGLEALLGARVPSRGERIVLVHDAARPLVPLAVVRRVVDAVDAGSPAVVPVIPVTDTVRRLGPSGSTLLDRAVLRAVQTPQGFDLSVLLAAHRSIGDRPVTDDATVCELAGYPVTLVDGATESFKITHGSDLALAEAVLADRLADGTVRAW